MFKILLQIILTVLVLAAGFFISKQLINTAPEAKRQPVKKEAPLVEVMIANLVSYTVMIETRGTVSPRTESTLISQVAGQVLNISDNFRAGGFFEKGDVLLKIDPIDYELALTSAKAEQATMRLALSEEKAQAKQAESDWKKLGMKGKPDALVLRRPQLANARAALSAAEARIKRAEVDLKRTEIIAPYAGRILEQQVDIGQFVAPSSMLAKIYATDYVEVRLPLTDRQQALVTLPESYRGEVNETEGPHVTFTSNLGGKQYSWQGRIVRTEGSIDTSSRQLFVIAQVDDPYLRDSSGRPPLKIGQFVRAAITGQKLENVFVLPRAVLAGSGRVLVADQNNKIQRRAIETLWQDQKSIVCREGLQQGDQIIISSLPYAVDGSEIRLTSDQQHTTQAVPH